MFKLNHETLDVFELKDHSFPLIESQKFYFEKLSRDLPSKIIQKFDEQKYLIDIRFNLIDERVPTQNLLFDKRKSLFELKQKLSEIIHLHENEFFICNNMLSKKQFKNLSISIENLNIFDGAAIFLCKGKPLQVGEFLFNFYFLKNSSFYKVSSLHHPDLYINQLCKQFILHENMNSFDILRQILVFFEENENSIDFDLLNLLKSSLEENLFCIREKKGNRVGKCLIHQLSLLENFDNDLQDDLELFIQIIDDNNSYLSSITKDQMIFYAVKWNSSSWSVSDNKFEIILPKNPTLFDCKQILALQSNISTSFIQIVKSPPRINDIVENCPISIAVLNWNTPEHISLTGSPWYLKEGDYLLFKDSSEPEKEDIDPELKAALISDGIEESIYIHTEFD